MTNNRFTSKRMSLCVICGVLGTVEQSAVASGLGEDIWVVDGSATDGENDGTSWDDAFLCLNRAVRHGT